MIINSILDNDFYKFTMMHAVLEKYPDAQVTYKFINRSPEDRFDKTFYEAFSKGVQELADLKLTDEEYEWFKALNMLPIEFLDKLREFRFNPDYVTHKLTDDGELELSITGPWSETILFEVPLMAMITETYYKHQAIDKQAYKAFTQKKGEAMGAAACVYSDFGTRRRHSFNVQDLVVQTLAKCPGYIGTSNVKLSMKHKTTPIGTMAHEWIMGHAGMFGVEGVNTKAMQTWLDVFQGKFAIALTDTYTSKTFFKEFTPQQAAVYEGLRQDSGVPEEFADKALSYYKKLEINTKDKKIIFSDGLTWKRVIEIEQHVAGEFNAVYGIGTHLTNDFNAKKPLNIVIKLNSINGQHVFKLTDSATKATGKIIDS